MQTRDKYIFFGLLLFGFCYFLNAVSNILLPFIMGVLIAYLLGPLVDKMEKKGIARWLASLFIVLVFFTSFVAAAVWLLPVVYKQALSLISKVPGYFNYLIDKVLPYVATMIDNVHNGEGEEKVLALLNEQLRSSSEHLVKLVGGMVNNVWSSSLAVLNVFSLLSVAPITAYYILNDWNKVKDTVEDGLPLKHKGGIKKLWGEIDGVLSAYIRGQVIICLSLAVYYAVTLVFIGLDYGIFVGLSTGLVSFIPYIGPIFGALVGSLIAFFQWNGDLVNILVVLGVFISGQFIEGNFITPKLMGERLGVHPIWIIFGLFAGGTLMGFWGMLLAVPVTAVLNVLVKRSFAFYKIKYVDIHIGDLGKND